MTSPLDAARSLLAECWRGLRGVMGADAYEKYRAHHERVHPGEPCLTPREFWRDRVDEQDRNPGARCC